MRKFIKNSNDKHIIVPIICSIFMILAILILIFEPYAEIPFVYNQF